MDTKWACRLSVAGQEHKGVQLALNSSLTTTACLRASEQAGKQADRSLLRERGGERGETESGRGYMYTS